MKKALGNKKIAAAFMMVAMMVCIMTPVVQAGYHITKSGSMGRNADGYYSITTVAAYNDDGEAVEVTVGSRMPDTKWTYVTGVGRVTVKSDISKMPGGAMHAIWINGKLISEWIQN